MGLWIALVDGRGHGCGYTIACNKDFALLAAEIEEQKRHEQARKEAEFERLKKELGK